MLSVLLFPFIARRHVTARGYVSIRKNISERVKNRFAGQLRDRLS
jgi:hypothetical protein